MGNWNDCKTCKDRKECEDPNDFWHRGCRFKHAFPNAYTKKGGLLIFDPKKIAKSLKKQKGDPQMTLEEQTCPSCGKKTLLVFANHGIKDCHNCGYSEDESKTIKCCACNKTLFGYEKGRQNNILEDIHGHGGKTYCEKCWEERK